LIYYFEEIITLLKKEGNKKFKVKNYCGISPSIP
jgi:hypothetical protein